jgi:peptidoglycan/xylan/chitin deacetylase (PgdA/CDA1 family)
MLSATCARVARLGAHAYYAGLRMCGVPARRRCRQEGGLILCYHNVVARGAAHDGDPGLHMPRERFTRQLRWLAAHYEILPLRELVHRVETGGTLRSTAAITFDDGYAGVFAHAAPVLESLGLPATVFVVADAPGRCGGFWWDIVSTGGPDARRRRLHDLRGDQAAILSEAQTPVTARLPATHRPADWATIRAHVGKRLDLGVHSATHRSLTTLDADDLRREIVTSRAVLHRATGVWPECFAFPYGLWDRRSRDAVRNAGYRAALTLDAGFNTRPVDLWALPRLNVPAGISNAAFEAWTAGVRGRRSW